MKILFVDDEFQRFQTLRRNMPAADIVWVQTVDAAQQVLLATEGMFDIISFDHDLGVRPDVDAEFPENMTVRPLIHWIKANLSKLPGIWGVDFIIHTSNPCGRDWLASQLKDVGLPFEIQTFH